MFKKRLLQLLKRCVAALLMVVLPAQAFAHNALPKDLGRLDNALVHPALAGDKNALEVSCPSVRHTLCVEFQPLFFQRSASRCHVQVSATRLALNFNPCFFKDLSLGAGL
jgi:hypothetical protein